MKNMPIKKSYPASLTKITSNPMYKEQSISRIQSIQSIPSVSKLPKILTKMDDSLLSNIARSYKNNDALSNVMKRDPNAQYPKRPEEISDKLRYGRRGKN